VADVLSPECLIVDITAPGGVRKLGEYICQIAYDGEPLGRTLDVDCAFRTINGATPYLLDGEHDLIELTVGGREKAPIVGLGSSRVAVAARSRKEARWVALEHLSGRERLLVPVLEGVRWMLCSAPIRQLRKARASLPKFIPDSKPLLMSLWLDGGKGKSYWCPGGVVHV
jgi:hypothetical protein